MPRGQHPRGKPISPALRAAAAALVEELGSDRLAAAEIGIGPNTLARAIGGMRILRGNTELLRKRFPGVADEA